ncbi:hypothetical protein FBU59_000922 [Linderina macrospora]|uniref:Uncharacterized protein n=1 Tax=Linderina macrospora TaxID=4868 RepID=A0ACC1JFQ1_9FUNG|nr:hypothetical protein FBU59_000922 [Linderina macrospora]
MIYEDSVPVASKEIYKSESKTDIDINSNASTKNHDEDGHIKRTSSSLGAFFNMTGQVLGSGSLQLPYVLARGGWIGLIVMGICGLIAVFSAIITIRCLHAVPGKRLLGFVDIGQASFGKPGRYFAYFFHALYCFGTCCLYIILSGTTIHTLLVPAGVTLDKKFWMFLCTFIMWIPYVCLKQMAETAIISMFGLLSSVVVVLIAVGIAFHKPYLSHGPIPTDNPHAIVDGTTITHMFVHWSGVPTALATFSFAFAGNAIYPYIEGSMRTPRHWPYVSVCAMVVITSFYMLCGAAGYHAYGNLTVSPMLDNLPRGAASVAAQILIVIHVIIAVPVLMTSLSMEIEKSFKITPQYMGKWKERIARTATRTLLIGALMGISMAIPYFSEVMTLVGALSTGCVFLIEPILFYWKLYGFKRIPWWQHIIGVVMLALGLLAMVLGTKDGAIALRDAIKADKSS